MTSSVPMTIFFYKGLTRNLEIGNTPSEFCPISRLGQVRDTKSSRNVSNGAKCQGYSLIKLSPPPSHPLLPPSPPKIRLRYDVLFFDNILENLEIVAKKTMYYSRGII